MENKSEIHEGLNYTYFLDAETFRLLVQSPMKR